MPVCFCYDLVIRIYLACIALVLLANDITTHTITINVINCIGFLQLVKKVFEGIYLYYYIYPHIYVYDWLKWTKAVGKKT